MYAVKNDVTRFRRLGEFDMGRSYNLQSDIFERYTYLNQTLFNNCVSNAFINSLHYNSPALWLFFTSVTKKAGTYRAAPVNHIGYLRTFIVDFAELWWGLEQG